MPGWHGPAQRQRCVAGSAAHPGVGACTQKYQAWLTAWIWWRYGGPISHGAGKPPQGSGGESGSPPDLDGASHLLYPADSCVLHSSALIIVVISWGKRRSWLCCPPRCGGCTGRLDNGCDGYGGGMGSDLTWCIGCTAVVQVAVTVASSRSLAEPPAQQTHVCCIRAL